MVIKIGKPSLLRKSGVVILSLFLCAPATAQLSVSTPWNKCELDCINAGGGENIVKACKALCPTPAGSNAGAMMPQLAVKALPPAEPKPVAPAGKDRARPEKRQ